MTNGQVAFGLLIAGALSWFAPDFSGFLFEPANVRDGEARIASSVYVVGAAIVWFLRR